MFNVTLVSYEMYIALCKPIKYRRMTSKKRALKLVFLAWISGLAVGVIWDSPFLIDVDFSCFIWPEFEPFSNYPPVIGTEIREITTVRVFNQITIIITFTINLIINLVLYILIVYTLYQNWYRKSVTV